jgi:hypothetical protein
MAVLLLAIVAGAGLGLVQTLRILSEPVIPPSIESPAPPALPMAFVIPDVPADDQPLSADPPPDPGPAAAPSQN